ncbi:EthD family reductase [Zavarzinia aquatilis]|uniref:EthD family reductase n=1 Tax=Zavarzinia aquatilis TaxID=2211142 RepID=A0A317DS84_9PROT|nr:EthD family reductase [Zavarzinia aquatilis]PWR17538.1 EthD family reductase [Zavarzinia aquatilis]
MHKMQVLCPAPADPAAFLSYYEAHHLPLARRLPGLRAERHVRPSMLSPGAAVFLIWEGVFDDRQAMFAALKSDIGQAVAQDVPNYSPAGATMLHYPIEGAGS